MAHPGRGSRACPEVPGRSARRPLAAGVRGLLPRRRTGDWTTGSQPPEAHRQRARCPGSRPRHPGQERRPHRCPHRPRQELGALRCRGSASTSTSPGGARPVPSNSPFSYLRDVSATQTQAGSFIPRRPARPRSVACPAPALVFPLAPTSPPVGTPLARPQPARNDNLTPLASLHCPGRSTRQACSAASFGPIRRRLAAARPPTHPPRSQPPTP